MVVSQDVLPQRAGAAIFLVATVEDGAESDVRQLLADLSGLTRSVGFRLPDRDLSCVVGIGAALWDRLFAGPRPASLHPFHEIAGARHVAVSTPGDLLFHLRAHQIDVGFELARQLTLRLGGRAQIVDEVHGFTYFDQRDLMGFVDGTENPRGDQAREAAIVAGEDQSFAGGSYVIVQKYLHDLKAWNALPVETQERIIGRALELRQHRPFVFDRQRDDAARVDRLALVHDKNIVEVEKIQRADRLQLTDVRPRGSHVPGDKRAKVALV